MALPLIPIILAVSALGSGILHGISNAKNAKAEATAVAQQLEAQANERARQAKKLMQQQKTSFLKSGIYFDSGSPLAVINDTFDTMNKDINDMKKDANAKINKFMREGKTAFYNSMIESVASAGMAYFMGGGEGISSLFGKSSTTTAGSLKSKLSTAIQNATGKYKGSFNQTLPTSNGLPVNSGTLNS